MHYCVHVNMATEADNLKTGSVYRLISSGRASLTPNCCLLVCSKCQGPALHPVCAYFGGKTSRSYICWHKEEENVNISQCQMSVLMNAVTQTVDKK